MRKLLVPALLCMFTQSIHAGAVHDGKPLPEDPQARCRIATTEMIKLGERNMAMASSEQRRAKYEKDITSWKQRLETDEDPCVIYRDAFNAAFTY
ncbi:MAG: hypothetical protein RLT87_02920 [Gammaproteobacteria bacterium]